MKIFNLDNLDHKAERQREGDDDEEDGANNQEMCTDPLALFTC